MIFWADNPLTEHGRSIIDRYSLVRFGNRKGFDKTFPGILSPASALFTENIAPSMVAYNKQFDKRTGE